MSVDDIDILSNDDIPEYREERKYCWKRRLSIDDEEWDIIDLEAIGEVAHAMAGLVRMCYDYYLVATIPEFLEEGALRLDLETEESRRIKRDRTVAS